MRRALTNEAGGRPKQAEGRIMRKAEAGGRPKQTDGQSGRGSCSFFSVRPVLSCVVTLSYNLINRQLSADDMDDQSDDKDD